MYQSIDHQSKYHSYVLCQTSSPTIAEKFPYYILSINNKLIYTETVQRKDQWRYNYTTDSIIYQVRGNQLILTDGKWINKIVNNQAIDYQSIREEIKNNLKFYYYCGENIDKFIEIYPKYLFKNVLILELGKIRSMAKGRVLHQPLIPFYNDSRIFNYSSDYALLSQPHFFNCLVEGYKSYGCYIQHEGLYYWFMEKQLLSHLLCLYTKGNL